MGVGGVTPLWEISSHQCLLPSIEAVLLADAGEESINPFTQILDKKNRESREVALGLSGCIYLTQYNIMGVGGVTPFWKISSHQCLLPSIEAVLLADVGEESINPFTQIKDKKNRESREVALGLSGCIYLTQYNIMGVGGVTPFWKKLSLKRALCIE
ncbi:MAG: hypothetical protein F6K41_25885 [Symploca sp. SIO3E6]|nr:hypothetical protein [Caldora sp. SIO3E6]